MTNTYQHLETLFENDVLEVYQACVVGDQEKVIVKSAKALRPSPQLLASFLHEFQINNSLDLKKLVHCKELIDQHDAHQLIYDYEVGESLRHFLKSKPLTLGVFFPIALGITSAIAELHAHHVIHKDIKPENILIDPENLNIKLIDLSLASQLSVAHQEVTSVNRLEGSLPYMAPEQTGRINLPIDYRSDYYALGVTFYDLLSGVQPFICADSLGYVHCHLAVEAVPVAQVNPNVPQMLSKLVAKMMAKSPRDRYQSSAGLLADLQQCFTQWQETQTIPEFILGQSEAQDNLILSTTMYGREQEISTLLDSFERVKAGGVEALLVCGYSGIGKTTLINELQRPITMGRGHYVSGKFDLLQRTKPYSAFISAFANLVAHWLSESEEQLVRRRGQLHNALGSNAQVIIEFLPELELILGPQPAIESLPPDQAQNRFLYHFQSFVVASATIEEPLVMFIDDLQWIDRSSLLLLEQLLTTQDVQSLFFLGAYRDNEVDDTHPFVQLIAKLKKKDVVVQEMTLGPLSMAHSELFIADSLHMEVAAIHPLAQAVFQKTQGNPFFSREFLKACYSDGLLTYSVEDKRWHWIIDGINELPGSDNVVDLMLVKIGKLPSASQKLLQLGACIGMVFDLELVATLTDSSELNTATLLASCLQEGLIQKTAGDLGYRFIHDRIQQAAYQMLTEQEKQQLHLKTGRLLFKQLKSSASPVKVFDILDHLKHAIALIEEKQEQKELAELSLTGGKQALGAGAYQAAYDYLSLGIQWSHELGWDKEHNLLWQLHFESIDALFFLKKNEQALEMSNFLNPQCINEIETLKIIAVKTKIFNIQGQYEASYKLSLSALPIKQHTHTSRVDALIAYMCFRLRNGWGSSIADKINGANVVSNERTNLLSDILESYGWSAYILGHTSQLFISTLSFVNTVHDKEMSPSYIYQFWDALSGTLYAYTRNLREYSDIWHAEAEFLEKNKFSSSFKANLTNRLMNGAGYFISLSTMMDRMQPAIQTMIETGSYTSLNMAINQYFESIHFSDIPLPEFRSRSDYYLKIGKKIGMRQVEDSCHLAILSIDHLMQENKISLKDLDEVSSDKGLLFLVNNYYLMGEFLAAKKILDLAYRETRWVSVALNIQIYFTLVVLIHAQLQSTYTGKALKKNVERIKRYASKLKKFAEYRPETFLHLYLLAQAEVARIDCVYLKSMDLYRQAIKVAEKGRFIRWAAIASERLGSLYLEQGDSGAASYYFNEAIYFFNQWGCALKVSLLKEKYGPLLLMKQVDNSSGHATTSTSLMGGNLDVLTLIKASQAISGEIQLDKLLQVMLNTAVENAGAERGVFIEKIKNEWMVIAMLDVRGGQSSFTLPETALNEYADLPNRVIQYVLNSKESVVLSHATEDMTYREDPYIIRTHPKSLLCLPIIHHNAVMGVMYLENNLSVGAFTQDRVTVLSTLASQIAISLENAHFTTHLQELYKKTERFVPKKFLEIIHKENIESVTLGNSAKQDISVLFNDIRSFTTLVENLSPEEAFSFINRYWKFMAPIIRKHNGYIDQYQGDAILAIFPNNPADAVLAAVAMMKSLNEFNQWQLEHDEVEIGMGIGISFGSAMLGVIGEEERYVSGIISDVANTAARMEGLNKTYGSRILVSDSVQTRLPETFNSQVRQVDVVRLKGKKQITKVFEVIEWESQLENISLTDYLKRFSEAFDCYKTGDLKRSELLFSECLTAFHEDKAAAVLLDRCQEFLRVGLPDDWDGAYTLTQK